MISDSKVDDSFPNGHHFQIEMVGVLCFSLEITLLEKLFLQLRDLLKPFM